MSEETKTVTLAGGVSEEVSFSYLAEAAGKINIEVNGLKAEFTVKEPPAPTQTPIVTEKPQQTAEPEPAGGANIGLILGIIGGCVLIAVGGVFYFIRRRK